MILKPLLLSIVLMMCWSAIGNFSTHHSAPSLHPTHRVQDNLDEGGVKDYKGLDRADFHAACVDTYQMEPVCTLEI